MIKSVMAGLAFCLRRMVWYFIVFFFWPTFKWFSKVLLAGLLADNSVTPDSVAGACVGCIELK